MLKNTLVCATIALSTIISSNAQAATQDVGASLTAHGAIAFSNVQDISFGHIDYDVIHKGSLRLGTDGNIKLVGDEGLVLSGSASSGSMTVSSDGTTVEISCDQDATLTNANGDTIGLNHAIITNGVGVDFEVAKRCADIGNQPLVDSTGIVNLKFGGALTIGTALGGNNLTGGTYSTANAGGSPITVSVVYQ